MLRYRLLLLGSLVFLLCFSSVPVLAGAPAVESLSPDDEGVNAEIVTGPGADVDALRLRIKEHDKLSRQLLLSKDEKRIRENFGQGNRKNSPHFAGGTVTVQAVSSFNPVNTDNGAILLGYSSQLVDYCAQGTFSGYCHAGLFDKVKYTGSAFDAAILTANTAANSPGGSGMKYEQIYYWQTNSYQEIREMVVSTKPQSIRDLAVTLARGYSGPYDINTHKTANDKWYCSKVVYRGYNDATSGSLMIDADLGYWVTPGDIRWSSHTSTVRVYL